MIRRQLLEIAPLLAHYFPGLLPTEYHRYTVEELNQFVAALPQKKG